MKKKQPQRKKGRLLVQCPSCETRQFEVTKAYDPKKMAHPGMVQMIEPYLSWGWEGPPPDPSAGYGVMECGQCGSALAPHGFLKVVEETV